MGLRAGFWGVLGLGMLVMAGPAAAQDNLDRGKSPAQLFASDCTICHKSPAGLSKGGGLFGLSGFLREHYTTSRELASALAAYIELVDRAAAASAAPKAAPKRAVKRTQPAKPVANTKPDSAAKPDTAKSANTKDDAPKASESKAEAKPVEAKPAEAKPAEVKPVEAPKSDKSE